MQVVCNNCGNQHDHYTAMIFNGKFCERICGDCRADTLRFGSDAAYQRAMGRDDASKDIIQPFIDGVPNPDFAHAYPEHAKEMFSEEEMSEM